MRSSTLVKRNICLNDVCNVYIDQDDLKYHLEKVIHCTENRISNYQKRNNSTWIDSIVAII